MALITPEYEKAVRIEKIKRLLLAFSLLLISASAVGLVLMVPSYFAAVFSEDEILRRLRSSEDILAKKNFKDLETEIEKINETIGVFDKNESLRRDLAPILVKIANSTPKSVKLKLIKLDVAKGEALITLNGRAERREDFLNYFEKLKGFPEAEIVVSPVTNLLKETDVVFVLELKIKKEIYGYAP